MKSGAYFKILEYFFIMFRSDQPGCWGNGEYYKVVFTDLIKSDI